MRLNRLLPVGFALAMIALSGCTTQLTHSAPKAGMDASATAGVSSSGGFANEKVSASKASKDIRLPDFIVERRYQDVFRENDKDIPVTVEYGWDYRAGVGVERIYDRGTRTLRSERSLPGQTLTFSDQEVELSFAIAREAPELALVLSEPNLYFYSGFAYYESSDPDCFTRSRCVHVLVGGGEDSKRTVAHAIVDLMTRRVIHPFFAPVAPDANNQH